MKPNESRNSPNKCPKLTCSTVITILRESQHSNALEVAVESVQLKQGFSFAPLPVDTARPVCGRLERIGEDRFARFCPLTPTDID
jgi:hypothetical protein